VNRGASLIWPVVEVILAVLLLVCAAIFVVVGIGFASDNEAPRMGIAWLIAIALTFAATVSYKHAIRRLRFSPTAWSVVEIALAIFLLLCAAVVSMLGLAAAQGAPHAFGRDLPVGIFCWLMALATAVGAVVLFRRSMRRLRSLRAAFPLTTKS
jgi:drug/metabolite transporter (DMT)-like permease